MGADTERVRFTLDLCRASSSPTFFLACSSDSKELALKKVSARLEATAITCTLGRALIEKRGW